MFWKTRAWKKTTSCAVKNIILYVFTVFTWKKFKSIHRSLCPVGCMPWIILRLFWIFMCQGCRTQRWQNHWVPLLCFYSIWIYLRLLQVILQNILITWLVLWETSAFCSLISQRFWGNNIIMLLFSLGAVFNDRNCINTTGSPHTPTHCHHHNDHNLLWFSSIKLYSAGLIIVLQWIKISRNVSYTF